MSLLLHLILLLIILKYFWGTWFVYLIPHTCFHDPGKAIYVRNISVLPLWPPPAWECLGEELLLQAACIAASTQLCTGRRNTSHPQRASCESRNVSCLHRWDGGHQPHGAQVTEEVTDFHFILTTFMWLLAIVSDHTKHLLYLLPCRTNWEPNVWAMVTAFSILLLNLSPRGKEKCSAGNLSRDSLDMLYMCSVWWL